MSRATRHAVGQICDLIEAGYWSWDEARAEAITAGLDEPALTLIGEMWRLMAIKGEPEDGTGMASPLHSLFDSAVVYAKHGEDPYAAARFRDLVDEQLHQEQLDRHEALVEDAFRQEEVAA